MPGAVLHRGGGSVAVQLPPGKHADPSAATEMDYAGHDSRDHAVHAVLCDPLPDRVAADDGDEDFGAVAGNFAADVSVTPSSVTG